MVCFFGEGASNQGSFHEALNLAAIRKLPVVFVCENNHWALSADFEATTAVANVADRAVAYGMDGHIVDGNDIAAVYATTHAAVQAARRGDGPCLIECKTYRWEEHSVFPRPDPRPQEQIESWKRKDPIARTRRFLLDENTLDEPRDQDLQNLITQLMDDAEKFATDSPMPGPADAVQDVYV